MYDIIDYLKWRGDLSFDKVGISEVDNLVFSELVYLDLTDIAENEGATLFNAAKIYFKEGRGEIYKKYDKTLAKEEIKLLKAIVRSDRYCPVKVSRYEESSDVENPMQFCACVFEVSKNCIFVAFRGTDYTINGWKEDFLMTAMDVVPSQTMALEYFNRIAKLYPETEIYLGGHSKGGNLAVYAAAKCDKEIQSRIKKVYSNDGPGFSEEFFSSEGYRVISDRVIKIIPQASFIGMLFDREENYIVIKSKQKSFWQHDAFNWAVMGNEFVRLNYDTKSIRFADKTMKTFLSDLTTEQKMQITEAVFEVMASGGKITFADIRKAGIKNIPSMLKAVEKVDADSKKTIIKGVRFLAYLMIKNGYEVNFSNKESENNKYARRMKKENKMKNK